MQVGGRIAPHGAHGIRPDLQHGIPAPFFKEMQGYLVVTVRAEMGFSEPSRVKRFGDGSEKSSEMIHGLLRTHHTAGASEIAAALGLTSRAVEKQIAALKAAGCLRRVGPDKGGRWKF